MRCPGQDSRYWKEGAIFEAPCSACNNPVEFFKDEATRRCKKCGHKMVNPRMDFGCAAYCKFAEQCLGELPPELLAQKNELLKDRVALEMKRYFKQDFKRIGRATKTARHADQIGREEKGDLAIILAAAYLHDIGIHEAEKKNPSVDPRALEEEGPPIAREILDRLGAKKELTDEVCAMIARHHHPRPEETVNFKVVHDAARIASLEEKQKEAPAEPERLAEIITKELLSESGRKLAKSIFFPAGRA
jgi:hypothetical protein